MSAAGISRANSRKKNNPARKRRKAASWLRSQERKERNKKVLKGHRRHGTWRNKQNAELARQKLRDERAAS